MNEHLTKSRNSYKSVIHAVFFVKGTYNPYNYKNKFISTHQLSQTWSNKAYLELVERHEDNSWIKNYCAIGINFSYDMNNVYSLGVY